MRYGRATPRALHVRGDAQFCKAGEVFTSNDEQVRNVMSAYARAVIPPTASLTEAVDYLLGEFSEPNVGNAAAFAFAFMDASRTMPAIQEITLTAYTGMLESLASILSREFPEVNSTRIRRAAYALVTLTIGHLWFLDLETSNERNADARSEIDAVLSRLRAAPPSG